MTTLTSSQAKSIKQKEAIEAVDANGGFALLAMATGTGKSKIGVDRSVEIILKDELAKILLVVPTEKLRDKSWMNEYEKWGFINTWQFIERTCYASLNTYEGEDWDLVILDESHNITELNSIFFHNNTVKSCIGLTATPPKDQIKVQLLSKILKVKTYRGDFGMQYLMPTYEVTLDEAVELGLVAPYEITIITMPLDSKTKYLVGGKPGAYFMQTELERYTYLSKLVMFGRNKFNIINRMRFIYTLKSKTNIAKKILENVIPKNKRTLIFCGSKEQANELCEHRYYSKPSPPKKPKKLRGSFNTKTNDFENAIVSKTTEYLEYTKKYVKHKEELANWKATNDISFEDFCNLKINRLACVDALNEGVNIPDVDIAFMVKTDSNSKNLWQRIGRIIRFRPGHIGKIIILAVDGTVDMDWLRKASRELDSVRIREITLDDLRNNRETITF